MIRKLLAALSLRRRLRRARVRASRPRPVGPRPIPPGAVVAAPTPAPGDRPGFDLAAAIAALENPAAWAALGPGAPALVRRAWAALFEADCVPLACPHIHWGPTVDGRPVAMVNVQIDAFPPERVDLLVAAATSGLEPTTAATLEYRIRRAGVLVVSADGAMIAPTEAEARALAGPHPGGD